MVQHKAGQAPVNLRGGCAFYHGNMKLVPVARDRVMPGHTRRHTFPPINMTQQTQMETTEIVSAPGQGMVRCLFVDDLPPLREQVARYFGGRVELFLAANGQAALEVLTRHPEIEVVVTDVHMPQMDGLALTRECRRLDPELGVIVISGEGTYENVVQALRLGARNFLPKPFKFKELESLLVTEALRCRHMRETERQRHRAREVGRFLVGIERLAFRLPNDLSLVEPMATRLVQWMEDLGVCNSETRQNTVLGLVELLTNSIEHGNLGIDWQQKQALLQQGEAVYREELARRQRSPALADRRVHIVATIGKARAEVEITDEGAGFDPSRLPDPRDPAQLFMPSGRGLLLARTFLHEVRFHGDGSRVTAVQIAPDAQPA
jgi:CheY-like chemotaxis protein